MAARPHHLRRDARGCRCRAARCSADQLERMHIQAGVLAPADSPVPPTSSTPACRDDRRDRTASPARAHQRPAAASGAAGPQGYAARLDRLERRLDMGGAPATAAVACRAALSAPASAGPPVSSAPPVSSGPRRRPACGVWPAAAPPKSAPGAPAADPAAGPADAGAPPDRAAGGPPDHAPSSGGPPQSPPPPPVPVREEVSGPTHTPAAGGLDQAAVVRAWPDILDWLSRNKRVTWTLVSANAQPLSFDGSRLVLAIETAGLAETFRRGRTRPSCRKRCSRSRHRRQGRGSSLTPPAMPVGRSDSWGGPITTPAALGGPAPRRSRPRPPRSSPARRVRRPLGPTPVLPRHPRQDQRGAGGDSVPDFMPTRPTAVGGPDWSSAPRRPPRLRHGQPTGTTRSTGLPLAGPGRPGRRWRSGIRQQWRLVCGRRRRSRIPRVGLRAAPGGPPRGPHRRPGRHQ